MLIRPEGGLDGAMSHVLRRVGLKHIKLVGLSNKQFLLFTKDFVRERSAQTIARFWRRYGWSMKIDRLADAYLTVKLTEMDARDMGFELFVKHLRKKFVIRVALLFYRRILYGAAEILKARAALVRLNIREFLAGYIVAFYSESIFEKFGPTEREVVRASLPLFECVHVMACFLAQGVACTDLPRHVLSTLPVLHSEYASAFNAWRTPDLEALCKRIVDAVCALCDAFRCISTYEPVDEPVRVEFRRNTRRLRDKLDEMRGPGTSRMLDEYMVGCLVYETWDPLNPIDWTLWANFHMDDLFAAMDEEYWEARATFYMSIRHGI